MGRIMSGVTEGSITFIWNELLLKAIVPLKRCVVIWYVYFDHSHKA